METYGAITQGMIVLGLIRECFSQFGTSLKTASVSGSYLMNVGVGFSMLYAPWKDVRVIPQ